MTPEIMSTHGLPRAHQLDAWRGWFSSVFEVEKPDEARQGFLAESRYWALDGFGIGQVSAPGLRAVRSRELVRRNPVDHWCLTLGQHDTGIRTPEDSVAVPAGIPFLVSLGVDLASERAADERLHIYLPRDSFAEIATQLDAARGLLLETGLGRLLGHFLRNLVRSLPELAPADLPQVNAAARAMIGACVIPTPERIRLAAGQIDATRRDRLRRIVRRNIESPQLDAGMLCGALGVSRTQLYRLLQGEGGVAHYIRKLRLEVGLARLSDPSHPGTIAEIAAQLGFEDASRFSRAFRQAFGATPREVRARARAEPPGWDAQGIRPLSDFLRGL
ncbi:AraC family transcriptional regulator [Roseococcus sp. SYP-B2431]|uniref:helix-turn-helix transcriptional regulator n=1 Tax=Roseococcus sp. SYP-B2431 TaxID=2496640 RepID=UPI00103CE69C|nr:helix-turn-helix transcriptional regulator [Roseococcus sp. SYP-B2431]TCH99094.1 AraC family transcriptional regulator [Roseococcus sp. SYP-B2431]